MATVAQEKPSLPELADALRREPLIGVTAAAKLIGIPPPNFHRDAAPHLVGVPVEGSANVYFLSQVRKFAKARAKARKRPNGNGNGGG